MHFFFGVGAFFTPIIVKSFLNSNFDITITSNSFNCYNIEETVKYKHFFTEAYTKNPDHLKLYNDTATRTNPLMPSILLTRTQFTSQTKYAFWILALIQLPAPIFLFMYMARFKDLENDQLINDEEQQQGQQTSDLKDSSNSDAPLFSLGFIRSLFSDLPMLQMILLISFLVFLFEGLVVSLRDFV